jgi:hypothetical protein
LPMLNDNEWEKERDGDARRKTPGEKP